MNKVIQTANLKNLVRVAGHPAYKTVEALAVGIAGDLPAGTMLYRLLCWMPCSKRGDGSVYKSATDWLREAGLTEAQVKRAKKRLPRCGVGFETRKAKGVPTTHYRLDHGTFLLRASELLELPLEIIFTVALPEPSGEGEPMVLVDSARSITYESNTESNTFMNHAADEKEDRLNPELPGELLEGADYEPAEAQRLLRNAGVHYPMNRQLAKQHDLATVRAAIALADKGADWNPPGFIVDALRSSWIPTPAPSSAPPPSPPTEAETEPDITPDDITEETPAPPEEKVIAIHNDTWLAAYQQLELQLDRASFDTWLRKARLIAVDGQHYTVAVHTTYAQTMLQHRLYRNVCRVLSDVAGEPVEITFVVKAEMPLVRLLAMNE